MKFYICALIALLICLYSLPLQVYSKAVYVTGSSTFSGDCETPETACGMHIGSQKYNVSGDEFIIVNTLYADDGTIHMHLVEGESVIFKAYNESSLVVQLRPYLLSFYQFTNEKPGNISFEGITFKDFKNNLISGAISEFKFENCKFVNSSIFTMSVRKALILNCHIQGGTTLISRRILHSGIENDELFMRNLTIVDHRFSMHKYSTGEKNKIVMHLDDIFMTGSSTINFNLLKRVNSISSRIYINNLRAENITLSNEPVLSFSDFEFIEIKNSEFKNNNASIPGVSFSQTEIGRLEAQYTISNVLFENNIADVACVQFAGFYRSTVENVIFRNNQVTDAAIYEFGSVAIKYTGESQGYYDDFRLYFSSIITSCIFENNFGFSAGAIAIQGFTHISITNNSFINNSAMGANAIYAEGFKTLIYKNLFESNTYIPNPYHAQSGVIVAKEGNIGIFDNIIRNSDTFGIYLQNVKEVGTSSNRIENNNGGMYFGENSLQTNAIIGDNTRWHSFFPDEFQPSNDVIINNHNCGAKFLSFQSVYIAGLDIENNECDYGGGLWIQFDRPRQVFTLEEVNIKNNRAIGGGAIYLQMTETSGFFKVMNKTNITGNSALRAGGAIFADVGATACHISFHGTTSNNNALVGNGIFWNQQVNPYLLEMFNSVENQSSNPQTFAPILQNIETAQSWNLFSLHPRPSSNVIVNELNSFTQGIRCRKQDLRGVVYVNSYVCIAPILIYDCFGSVIDSSFPFSPNGFIVVDKKSIPRLNVVIQKEMVLHSQKNSSLWELTLDVVAEESNFQNSRVISVNVLLYSSDGKGIIYESSIPFYFETCPSGYELDGICVNWIQAHLKLVALLSFLTFILLFLLLSLTAALVLGLLLLLFFVFKRDRKKGKYIELINQDMKMMLLEEAVGEDGPKISINKKLFEVNFEEIQIVKRIGTGGSGAIVFEVMWKGEKAALKLFKTNAFADEVVYEAFESEVSLLSSCRHPGIIGFYGCSLKKGRVGILMELCPRGSLRSYIESMQQIGEVPFTFEERLKILTEIARCMNYLHTVNVVHRDLKAENILLDENLRPKLIDFGLSKVIESGANNTTRIGTRTTMAPELIRGGDYNEKVDVYSFGILLYQILTDDFDVYSNEAQVEFKVATDPNFRPQATRENVPNYEQVLWYISLMHSCWEHAPEYRPSFEMIVEILEKHSTHHVTSIKPMDYDEL